MAGNENANKLDRRQFLAGVSTALIISSTALIHPAEAWGLEVKNLKPETMRTLIKMARDIYPHDRLADRFYAVAMKGYDEKAGSDAATRAMLETGVSTLDELARKKHGVAYADVDWEASAGAGDLAGRTWATRQRLQPPRPDPAAERNSAPPVDRRYLP